MSLKKKPLTLIFFSIILSFYIVSCVLPTLAELDSTEIGDFVSKSPVLQDQYLWVTTTSSKIDFAFVTPNEGGTFTKPESTLMDTVTNIGGVSPNYSFYNGNISGTLSFSDTGVTVSLSRNIAPSLVLRNIICDKQAK